MNTTQSVESLYPINTSGAESFRNDVAQLAKALDTRHVPKDGRCLYVHPWIGRMIDDHPRALGFDDSDHAVKEHGFAGTIEGLPIMVNNQLETCAMAFGFFPPTRKDDPDTKGHD